MRNIPQILKCKDFIFFIILFFFLILIFPQKKISYYGLLYLENSYNKQLAIDSIHYLNLKENINPDTNPQDAQNLMRVNTLPRIFTPNLYKLFNINDINSAVNFQIILLFFSIVLCFFVFFNIFKNISTSLFSSSIYIFSIIPWNTKNLGYPDIASYILSFLIFYLTYLILDKNKKNLFLYMLISLLIYFALLNHEANSFSIMIIFITAIYIFGLENPKKYFGIIISFGLGAFLYLIFILSNLYEWKQHFVSLSGSSPIFWLMKNKIFAAQSILYSYGIYWIFYLYESRKKDSFFLLMSCLIICVVQFFLAVDTQRLMGAMIVIMIFVCSKVFNAQKENYKNIIFFLIVIYNLITPYYHLGTNIKFELYNYKNVFFQKLI